MAQIIINLHEVVIEGQSNMSLDISSQPNDGDSEFVAHTAAVLRDALGKVVLTEIMPTVMAEAAKNAGLKLCGLQELTTTEYTTTKQ